MLFRSALDPSPVFGALSALFELSRVFRGKSEKETGPCQRCDRNCIQEKCEVSNQEIREHRRATLENSYRSIASCERAMAKAEVLFDK